MENDFTTEGKITATLKFSTPETTSSQLPTISITSRISELGHHLYILQAIILTATQLLKREPSFNGMSTLNRCTQRSLLPFLGDAQSWLTRAAMTKDIKDIKRRVTNVLKHTLNYQILSTCHFHTKHHHICHTSQQTTHQCSHGSSSEDTQ